MLTRVTIGTLVGALVFAVLTTPAPAFAGGVIIDGRTDPGAGLAGRRDSEGLDDSNDETEHQHAEETLTEQETELLLFAALVFNGHDAATPTGNTDETMSEIIDELEGGEPQGGCAASPISGLAILGAALLLIRRRRR